MYKSVCLSMLVSCLSPVFDSSRPDSVLNHSSFDRHHTQDHPQCPRSPAPFQRKRPSFGCVRLGKALRNSSLLKSSAERKALRPSRTRKLNSKLLQFQDQNQRKVLRFKIKRNVRTNHLNKQQPD